MERINPQFITNYEHMDSDPKKGIVQYGRLFGFVTKLFGKSVSIGKAHVNIKSASRYICDVYLKNDKTEQPLIEKIIKNLSEKEKEANFAEVINVVLEKLAHKETVPGDLQQSVLTIFQKALKPSEIPSLKETKELIATLEKVQKKEGILHLSSEIINPVRMREWDQIQQEYATELKLDKDLHQAVETALTKEPANPNLDNALLKVEKFCSLTKQFNKICDLELLPLKTDFSNAKKSIIQYISPQQGSKIPLEEIQEQLNILEKKILRKTQLRIETERSLENQKKQELLDQQKAARTIIDNAFPQIPFAHDSARVKTVISTPDVKEELLDAATFLARNTILQSIPTEDIKEALSLFTQTINMNKKNLVDELYMLFAEEKDDSKLKKLETFFITLNDTHFFEILAQQSAGKNLHASLYKIFALKESLPIATRLKASLQYLALKKDEDPLITVFQQTRENELKTILSSIPENIEISHLAKAFSKGFKESSPERLSILRNIAYDQSSKNIGKALCSGLGFNFNPVKDEETFLSSKSTNMLILQAPPGSEDSFIHSCRKSLSLSISQLRENPSSTVHPLFIGTEKILTAKNKEDLKNKLDSLAELSRDFRGVTIIPCIFSLDDPPLEAIPVFEDGRLVSLCEKTTDINSRNFPVFLLPNGISVAVGIGSTAISMSNKAAKSLPINQKPVDVLLLLRENSTEQSPFTHAPKLIIDSRSDGITALQNHKNQPISKPLSLERTPEPPFHSQEPLKLIDICSQNDVDRIRKLLTNGDFSPSQDSSSSDIRTIIEQRYTFSSETDSAAFIEALTSSPPNISLISSKYPKQFFSLLSYVKKPVIVYTDNPSIPIELYKDGHCSIADESVFQDPDTAARKNGIQLFFSSDGAFFPSTPPKEAELFTATKNSYTQKVDALLTAFTTCASKAKEGILDKVILKELLDKRTELEKWMYQKKFLPELLAKSELSSDFKKVCLLVDEIAIFYRKSQKFCSTTEDFFKSEKELFAHLETIEKMAQELFEGKKQPQMDIKNLSTPLRAWSTMLYLTQLGQSSANEAKKIHLSATHNRLCIDNEDTPLPASETLTDILDDLQACLRAYAQRVNKETRTAISKGLSRITTKYASGGWFFAGSIPQNLSKTIQATLTLFPLN